MNRLTNIIIWNVRSANNVDFQRNFREVINNYNPCMVALLETKMENYAPIRETFKFLDLIEVPTQGRAGRLVLMWMDNLVTVECIRQTD